jgi:hypothetical protein
MARPRSRRQVGPSISTHPRLSSGSKKANAAWKTHCVPNPWKSRSSTRSNCASCRRPTAKRCSSCVPEKSWRPCWATRTRNDPQPPAGTGSRWLQGQPGQAVPVVRHTPAHGVLPQHQGCAQGSGAPRQAHQGDDRREPVVQLPHGGASARVQQEQRAAHLPAQGLAGSQTAGGIPASYPVSAVRGQGTRRALGDGLVSRVGGARWVGFFGSGNRLLQPAGSCWVGISAAAAAPRPQSRPWSRR